MITRSTADSDDESLFRAEMVRSSAEFQKCVSALIRGGGRLTEVLIAVAQDGGLSGALRLRACQILGQSTAPTVVDGLLFALVLSPDDPPCFEAASALGKRGNARAVAPLVATVRDPGMRPGVRAAAAHALGWIQDKAAIAPLLELLTDAKSPPILRDHAAEALGYLRSRKALRVLHDALDDSDPKVRYSAALAVGWIGGVSSVRILRQLLEDGAATPSGPVRDAAAAAIRMIEERTKQRRKPHQG